MIYIHHNKDRVVNVLDDKFQPLPFNSNKSVPLVLKGLSEKHPEEKLVWIHEKFVELVDYTKIETLMIHDKILFSYNPYRKSYFGDAIGYVEDSPFIKINKLVRYATWQMSSCMGITSSRVINAIDSKFFTIKSFDYFLNSLAKSYMSLGLLCYSEPSLIKKEIVVFSDSLKINERTELKEASNGQLFQFVKEHYKPQWCLFLFLNFLVYERKIVLYSLFRSLWFSRIRLNSKALELIGLPFDELKVDLPTVDVIIPTIGRPKLVKEVLELLAVQTHLPSRVIVVEQNPNINSASDLKDLDVKSFPYELILHFTHQTGACKARNWALDQTVSEYVFLADDDNIFDSEILSKGLRFMLSNHVDVLTLSYLQKGEFEEISTSKQWHTFGAGCSIVKQTCLEDIRFNLAYEFGYGEDKDFGMQLRYKGYDVIYCPDIKMLHLKAPIGGFRSVIKWPWSDDELQPKPSPTIMMYKLEYQSLKQLKGYKLLLFFQFYRNQSIKNPILYFKQFKRRWNCSLYWAARMQEESLNSN